MRLLVRFCVCLLHFPVVAAFLGSCSTSIKLGMTSWSGYVPARGRCCFDTLRSRFRPSRGSCTKPQRTAPRSLQSSSFHNHDEELEGWINLRLLSFNIHGWRDSDHHDSFERLAAIMRHVQPDVVALQEVLHPYRLPDPEKGGSDYLELVRAGRGKGLQLQRPDASYLLTLSKILQLPHVSFGPATNDGYFGAVPYGNAILSRFPIISEKHVVFEPDQKHQLGRRIEAEARSMSVLSLQTSVHSQHVFCVAHLDQLSDELRTEQLRFLLPYAAAAGPHLLCGDLNMFDRASCTSDQWEAILRDADSRGWEHPPETTAARQELQRRGYQDCFFISDNHLQDPVDRTTGVWDEGLSTDTDFPGPTIWVDKPLLRIDYAFLSSGWHRDHVRVKRYQRVRTNASDHFPILLDLQLAVPPAA